LSKLYNVTLDENYESKFNILTSGIGIRYAYTVSSNSIMVIQPYVYGLMQYALWDEIKVESLQSESFNEEISSSKFGFLVGAGVDLRLLPYVGIFLEGVYGYLPAKFKDGKIYNIDGYYLYFGASFCTSYGLIE